MATATVAVSAPHKPIYQSLYAQVLTAIAIGVALGHFYPALGEQMKPLGDAFIKLIKMIIAPCSMSMNSQSWPAAAASIAVPALRR